MPILDKRAKCLIDGLAAIQLKWNPNEPTTVHSGFISISSGFGSTMVLNKANYNLLRENHQIGCRDSTSNLKLMQVMR